MRSGMETEIIAPVPTRGILEPGIPVCPISVLGCAGRYHVVKTSYHFSIELLGDYSGPVISRIVRVVDEKLPARDAQYRERLLHCQSEIHKRAHAVVLNNGENRDRWRRLYGPDPRTVLIPNGCPERIPHPGKNPFPMEEKAVLFLGSVAAPRMLDMLNQAARRLEGKARIHLVGLNKAAMYGGKKDGGLDPLIVDHGELPESETWAYVQHARAGLALATGVHGFDNDISKIFNYLRGGLPVLSEAPILNNDLIRHTGYGKIFRYGDAAALVSQCIGLINDPPVQKRRSVMEYMAREHSWNRRVEAYARLLKSMFGKGSDAS